MSTEKAVLVGTQFPQKLAAESNGPPIKNKIDLILVLSLNLASIGKQTGHRGD